MTTGFGRRHRILKDGRYWYAICGTCIRTLWSPTQERAMTLLEAHVWRHLRD